jgi:L-cysteine S-thiosulfotransferase
MIPGLVKKIFIYSAIGVILHGCATDPGYATQFRFPIFKGDLEKGRQSFVALGCNQCHTVNGVELPAYAGETPLTFDLGGKIWYVKTYAELVTSIINPDHIISGEYLDKLPPGSRKGITSPMPLNENMTVTQLIDIVTFLNSRYMLMRDYSPY